MKSISLGELTEFARTKAERAAVLALVRLHGKAAIAQSTIASPLRLEDLVSVGETATESTTRVYQSLAYRVLARAASGRYTKDQAAERPTDTRGRKARRPCDLRLSDLVESTRTRIEDIAVRSLIRACGDVRVTSLFRRDLAGVLAPLYSPTTTSEYIDAVGRVAGRAGLLVPRRPEKPWRRRTPLSDFQKRALAVFRDNPMGGYVGGRKRPIRARPHILLRLGLIVQREPAGTGWELTDAGLKALGVDK